MVLNASSVAAPAEWEMPSTASAPVAPGPLRWHHVRRPVLLLALALAALGYSFLHWVVSPVKIDGESMMPNYSDGQPVFINRVAYRSHGPQRGDVVGLRVGRDFYIKRIIGLPGERIEFRREVVVINGKPLQEPYAVKALRWALPAFELGANDYFVMGDDRTQSKLGPIRRDQIVGKSVF